MADSEFTPRFCERCKEPKNRLIDGRDVITRCSCDWEAGYLERLRATVHQDFWYNRTKPWSLKAWDPLLFKYGGKGVFRNLIKVQKAYVINKLYDFCFKLLENDPFPGQRRYSLYRSMEKGRTLFIRGPNNSGRGCLVAYIKMFCAIRDISTTPNPADWSTFKSEVLASEWNGKEADLAKLQVAEQYQNVKVLVLENLKGEGQLQQGERFPRRPFRGANLVDSILTKRTFQQGCTVFTSGEFAREIGDTVGDKLPDMLDSDNTTSIIMFSPAEADSLWDGLNRKISSMRLEIAGMQGAAKETLQNKMSIERAADTVKECLFLEKAYPIVNPGDSEPVTQMLKFAKDNKYPAEVLAAFSEFNRNWTGKTLAYEEGLKRAYQTAAGSSKELSYKMSQKELIETGKMMSVACGSVDDEINALIDGARKTRDLIETQKEFS